MANALEIAGLTKRFAAIPAVDRLDLVIPQGEFHALLGPNGAGKTTTLRAVAGLLKADEGRVSVLGHDVASDPTAAKRVLSFLPDDPLVYDKLDALEYLEFVAGLWSLPGDVAARRAEELLRWLDLWPQARQRAEGYSRGMRQKLALAGALIHAPRVLILDEPTRGIDVGAKAEIYRLMRALSDSGVAVLMISSDMEEVIGVSDRVAVMHEGHIEGTLDRAECSEENILRLAVGRPL